MPMPLLASLEGGANGRTRSCACLFQPAPRLVQICARAHPAACARPPRGQTGNNARLFSSSLGPTREHFCGFPSQNSTTGAVTEKNRELRFTTRLRPRRNKCTLGTGPSVFPQADEAVFWFYLFFFFNFVGRRFLPIPCEKS